MTRADIVEAEVMESHDLVITKMHPGSIIEADWSAIDAKIADVIDIYGDVTVDLEYLPQAKKDRAYLNSLVKSVEQKRKDVKSSYLEPYMVFERQVKEHLAPVSEASAALDKQIKELEEQERFKKREEIVKHWEGCAGALAEAVAFERIFDEKWLNKTSQLMVVFSEIDDIIERIARDDATLDSLGLSHHIEAKAEYFATLDISKAIARSKALDEQEETARKLEEIKNANLAAREVQEPEPEPDAQPVAPEPTAALTQPQRKLYRFEITCTPAEFNDVLSYLKSRGITGKAVS